MAPRRFCTEFYVLDLLAVELDPLEGDRHVKGPTPTSAVPSITMARYAATTTNTFTTMELNKSKVHLRRHGATMYL